MNPLRALFSVLLIALTACTPDASSPSSSPATVNSGTPSAPTPSAIGASTPTSPATATLIPLTAGSVLAAAGGGVLWADVNGDHLFVSLNFGETWTERAMPPEPRSRTFAFISAGEGWWLVPATAGTQCGTQAVAIWKTDDGAASWRKLDTPGIDEVRCKTGIAFSGPGRGFIPASDGTNPPAIYQQRDGRTWSLSAALQDPPGFTSRTGSALQVGNIANLGSVLFVDTFGSVSGTLKHFVYRSVNEGETWSYWSTALESSAIVFLTPTRWIQISTPGNSRITNDSGQTWAFFATDYNQAAPVAPQIVFGDANSGYATVRGSLQRTTDGGLHWTALRTPGTYLP